VALHHKITLSAADMRRTALLAANSVREYLQKKRKGD
jgi:hypothetical protein